jgi:hypothetical protein
VGRRVSKLACVGLAWPAVCVLVRASARRSRVARQSARCGRASGGAKKHLDALPAGCAPQPLCVIVRRAARQTHAKS